MRVCANNYEDDKSIDCNSTNNEMGPHLNNHDDKNENINSNSILSPINNEVRVKCSGNEINHSIRYLVLESCSYCEKRQIRFEVYEGGIRGLPPS